MDKPENVIDHIMQYMKSKIDDGSWAIGEKIPSKMNCVENWDIAVPVFAVQFKDTMFWEYLKVSGEKEHLYA